MIFERNLKYALKILWTKSINVDWMKTNVKKIEKNIKIFKKIKKNLFDIYNEKINNKYGNEFIDTIVFSVNEDWLTEELKDYFIFDILGSVVENISNKNGIDLRIINQYNGIDWYNWFIKDDDANHTKMLIFDIRNIHMLNTHKDIELAIFNIFRLISLRKKRKDLINVVIVDKYLADIFKENDTLMWYLQKSILLK